jgi:D-serine deaminase-like pyridoxal phosphate-dependent protein
MNTDTEEIIQNARQALAEADARYEEIVSIGSSIEEKHLLMLADDKLHRSGAFSRDNVRALLAIIDAARGAA